MVDLNEELFAELDREKLLRMDPEERVKRLVAMRQSGSGPRKTIAVVCLRRAWEQWTYERLKAVAEGKLEDGILYATAFHCTRAERLRGIRLSDVIVYGPPVGWTMDEWAQLEWAKDVAKQTGTWRGK